MFPKHLGLKLKFQETETRFCWWKSNDYNGINIFVSMDDPCTFLLVKEITWKSIFNTNSDLSQNRTEKQVMPVKTAVNWLFNDIWRYLVNGCFDWKIGVFQQLQGLIVSFKLFSLISSFVMNDPYNDEHQNLSNISPSNLFWRFILILYSYSRTRYSVQLLLSIKTHFQMRFFIIQYLG